MATALVIKRSSTIKKNATHDNRSNSENLSRSASETRGTVGLAVEDEGIDVVLTCLSGLLCTDRYGKMGTTTTRNQEEHTHGIFENILQNIMNMMKISQSTANYHDCTPSWTVPAITVATTLQNG